MSKTLLMEIKEGKSFEEMVEKIKKTDGPEGQGIYGTLDGNCLVFLCRYYGEEVEIIGIEIKKGDDRVLSLIPCRGEWNQKTTF